VTLYGPCLSLVDGAPLLDRNRGLQLRLRSTYCNGGTNFLISVAPAVSPGVVNL
jgi:hypothetical protein